MSSVNKVILVGNLGNDPVVRYSASGDAVANVALATSEKWKGKDGQQQEKTEWHRVVFFKSLAEFAGKYLKKGSLIYIEGRMQTRKWDDKGVEKYTTEVVADKMQMLGGGPQNHDESSAPRSDAPRSNRSQFGKREGRPDVQRDDYSGDEKLDIPF